MVVPMLPLLMLRNCQTFAFDGEHEHLKLSASVLHAEKTGTSGSHWADSTPVRLTSSWITGLCPSLPTFFPAQVTPKLVNYRIILTMEICLPFYLILIIIAQYIDKANPTNTSFKTYWPHQIFIKWLQCNCAIDSSLTSRGHVRQHAVTKQICNHKCALPIFQLVYHTKMQHSAIHLQEPSRSSSQSEC